MKRSGFTMLEVMVAASVITIGIVGIVSLLQSTMSTTAMAFSKLTASYLAQEGLEIARNIRDANWLRARTDANAKWDDNLPGGDWRADYTTNSLTDLYSPGVYLKLNISGWYNYSAGTDTRFRRKITISNKQNLLEPPNGPSGIDYFTVTVVVEWQEKGKDYLVTAEERLYQWR